MHTGPNCFHAVSSEENMFPVVTDLDDMVHCLE